MILSKTPTILLYGRSSRGVSRGFVLTIVLFTVLSVKSVLIPGDSSALEEAREKEGTIRSWKLSLLFHTFATKQIYYTTVLSALSRDRQSIVIIISASIGSVSSCCDYVIALLRVPGVTVESGRFFRNSHAGLIFVEYVLPLLPFYLL